MFKYVDIKSMFKTLLNKTLTVKHLLTTVAITSIIGVIAFSCKPTPEPVVITKLVKPEPKEVVLVKLVYAPVVNNVKDSVAIQQPTITVVEPTVDMDGFLSGIKHWEGFRSKTYICCGGKKTIGYGFTGSEIKGRSRISKPQADKELATITLPKHLKNVDDVVTVPLNEHQRLALASFSYNLGRSNLIRLVSGKGRLNDGNYESVNKLMPLYVKAGGKTKQGLVKRRAWEVAVYNGNIHQNYGN